MQGMPESDVHALERLLSPSGALFKALLSADADGLINFIFPLERLPIRAPSCCCALRLAGGSLAVLVASMPNATPIWTYASRRSGR